MVSWVKSRLLNSKLVGSSARCCRRSCRELVMQTEANALNQHYLLSSIAQILIVNAANGTSLLTSRKQTENIKIVVLISPIGGLTRPFRQDERHNTDHAHRASVEAKCRPKCETKAKYLERTLHVVGRITIWKTFAKRKFQYYLLEFQLWTKTKCFHRSWLISILFNQKNDSAPLNKVHGRP